MTHFVTYKMNFMNIKFLHSSKMILFACKFIQDYVPEMNRSKISLFIVREDVNVIQFATVASGTLNH